ncbi:RNA polymerase sigma factor [Rhodohalobacter halophilus]|uniref:RNA polymerase sigma factor n=1 Tax=Rhodohalobacter halophilus TaxID=1812810 RepID=UPI0015B5435D|nr:RNA polymerase sigma-70 factor [Rhodohalobacter halophilus]
MVQKLNRGDESAFEELYLNYRARAFGLVHRYLKDSDLTEDVIQDVFVKIWNYRSEIDSEKSFEALLFTFLKNHTLNVIKMNKRRVLRNFEYLSLNKRRKVLPDEKVYQFQLEEIIEEALKKLPKNKRVIFELKRFEGLSNREIAEKLDISIHTVKSQFYRANKILQEYLSEQLEEI